jgi:hypothetical protein
MNQTITTAPVLESALAAFEAAKAAVVQARAEAKAAEARKVEGRKAVRDLMRDLGVTVEMLKG